ncbi:hypothetical protein PG988_000123 [Apiospora saccharicola]
MTYDLDAIANCVRRHYELLVKMAYLDPAAVQSPPAQGWSDEDLAVDAVRALGRSENVIHLLRRLPYLRQDLQDEKWEVYEETRPLSYLRGADTFGHQTAEECRSQGLHRLGLMPFDASYPPGMISLTSGRDATFWVIDTDEGLIFPVGLYVVDDTAPEDQPWRRNGEVQDVVEYFDSVYAEFMSLTMVAAPRAGYWEPRGE